MSMVVIRRTNTSLNVEKDKIIKELERQRVIQ